MSARVLVVEDEPLTRELYLRTLAAAGFDAVGAGDAAEARALARSGVVDVVTVDLGLPDVSGMSLAEEMRRAGDVGLIVVSRNGAAADRVAALTAGCDDYLVKPVHLDELAARVGAVARRRAAPRGVSVGRVRIDLGARTAQVDGRAVELTRGEFTILALLAAAGGAGVERERLSLAVARAPELADLRTVDALIRRIRRKFEALGVATLVETLPGTGYRLGDGR